VGLSRRAIAILAGAAVVYFLFPDKQGEEQFLAQYADEDAASTE
jgi:hypothetical protein